MRLTRRILRGGMRRMHSTRIDRNTGRLDASGGRWWWGCGWNHRRRRSRRQENMLNQMKSIKKESCVFRRQTNRRGRMWRWRSWRSGITRRNRSEGSRRRGAAWRWCWCDRGRYGIGSRGGDGRGEFNPLQQTGQTILNLHQAKNNRKEMRKKIFRQDCGKRWWEEKDKTDKCLHAGLGFTCEHDSLGMDTGKAKRDTETTIMQTKKRKTNIKMRSQVNWWVNRTKGRGKIKSTERETNENPSQKAS